MTGRTISRVLALVAASVLVGPAAASSSQSKGGSDFFKRLRLGQAATLRGGEYGDLWIRLTLQRYVDPAMSPHYRPHKGTRFVAFRLRYTNVGKRRYQDVPAADVELIDSFGSVYDSTSSLYGSVVRPWPVRGPSLNAGMTLDPRETFTAWMGWILPAKMHLREFRYTLAFGSSGAAWTLR